MAGVHSEQTIEEDQKADQGGGDQHAGVPTQPGKVKTDLLPKVPPGGKQQKPQLTGVKSARFSRTWVAEMIERGGRGVV